MYPIELALNVFSFSLKWLEMSCVVNCGYTHQSNDLNHCQYYVIIIICGLFRLCLLTGVSSMAWWEYICFPRCMTCVIISAIATSLAWREKCPQTLFWMNGREGPSLTWRTSVDPALVCQSRWDYLSKKDKLHCISMFHLLRIPHFTFNVPPSLSSAECIVVTGARWMRHNSSGDTRHVWLALSQHSRQRQWRR